MQRLLKFALSALTVILVIGLFPAAHAGMKGSETKGRHFFRETCRQCHTKGAAGGEVTPLNKTMAQWREYFAKGAHDHGKEPLVEVPARRSIARCVHFPDPTRRRFAATGNLRQVTLRKLPVAGMPAGDGGEGNDQQRGNSWCGRRQRPSYITPFFALIFLLSAGFAQTPQEDHRKTSDSSDRECQTSASGDRAQRRRWTQRAGIGKGDQHAPDVRRLPRLRLHREQLSFPAGQERDESGTAGLPCVAPFNCRPACSANSRFFRIGSSPHRTS